MKCFFGLSKLIEGDGNRNVVKILDEIDYLDGNCFWIFLRIFKILNCIGCFLFMVVIILVILLMVGVVLV